MKAPACIVLDFETQAIERRPAYPPVPVGLSIQRPGERKPRYFSWGHPTGNNCGKEDATVVLDAAWESKYPLLMQNSKFDIDVAETHFDLPRLPWERIHDDLFLLFLHDPHAASLSLKPAAERILGMPPEERDAVRDWLVDHKIAQKNQKDWGAHIAQAPGDVVGPYANGDVTRTKLLFERLYPEIAERGMLGAYDRERRLMPILLETERRGIRVDLRRMERDYLVYRVALATADRWLRKKLRSPNLNLDADKDVGDALDREGIITAWTWTKGGHGRPPQRSVAKKNMPLTIFNNAEVASVYGYRGRLQTCLSMFMETWLEMARETGGVIHTTWNQVRQSHGNDNIGTRSGRLSSSPNFQNISKDFEHGRTDGYRHPAFLGVPPLPLMRGYLLPDKGCTWARRDINQQELRLTAHYENGPLMQAYLNNPRLDVHSIVSEGITRIMGITFERTRVKNFVFQNIYGGGITAVTAALGCDRKTAESVVGVLMAVLPGYKKLLDECRHRGTRAIRTWGGREYYCEPPAYRKKYKRVMTYDYKRLNYLIQPSAADVTKEVIIRYDAAAGRESRFMLTVHDEFDVSMPKGKERQEMKLLRDCIQSIETDVPMLSDGETGPNWARLRKYRD
jgi:DNA polymerase I-like protein with 3'-5' exonuclease and polymerase domains